MCLAIPARVAEILGGDQAAVGAQEGGGDAAVVHRQALLALALDHLGRAAGVVDVDPRVVDGFLEGEAAGEPGEHLGDRGRDPAGPRRADREHGAVGVPADRGRHVGHQP